MSKCEYSNCEREGNYHLAKNKTHLYCHLHKSGEMILPSNGRKCQYIDKDTGKRCTTTATFGYLHDNKRIFCSKHKLKNMESKTARKCNYIDKNTGKKCGTRANHRLNEKGPDIRCAKHKTKNMINSYKKCNYIDKITGKKCETIPTFHPITGGPAIRCAKHVESNMITTDKLCDYIDEITHEKCKTRAQSKLPEDATKTRCAKHATENMINSHKKCEYIDNNKKKCKLRANFNLPGEKTPKFCSAHSPKDMIAINRLKCEYKNCTTCPVFGYPDEKKRRFCARHKKENMINLADKKCEYPNCITIASFGKLFRSKIHCAKHKESNEFSQNYPLCQYLNCNNHAYYTNDKSNYPKRCEKHHLSDDINLVESKCKNCQLPFLLNESTQLCDYCNGYEIHKIHKAKEVLIINYLKDNGISIILEDKTIPEGCSKYRPDAVIDCQYFMIILEVDEHQHQSYDNDCEKNRMLQLYQDYGGIPIIFVRYNPDNYTSNNTTIKPNENRKSVLLDLLNKLINNKEKFAKKIETQKIFPISVCYLFYDGFRENEKTRFLPVIPKI